MPGWVSQSKFIASWTECMNQPSILLLKDADWNVAWGACNWSPSPRAVVPNLSEHCTCNLLTYNLVIFSSTQENIWRHCMLLLSASHFCGMLFACWALEAVAVYIADSIFDQHGSRSGGFWRLCHIGPWPRKRWAITCGFISVSADRAMSTPLNGN